MPLVCPQCRTENSEQLRVCMACGAALPVPAATSAARVPHGQDNDTFDALYAPTLMMGAEHGAAGDPQGSALPPPRAQSHQRQRVAAPAPRRVAMGWALVAAAALAITGVAWWLLLAQQPNAPAASSTGAGNEPASAPRSRPDAVASAAVSGVAVAPSAPLDTPVAPAPLGASGSASSGTPTGVVPASRASGVAATPARPTAPITPASTASPIAHVTRASGAVATPNPAPRTRPPTTSLAGRPASSVPTSASPSVQEYAAAPAIVADLLTAPDTPRPTALQSCAGRSFLLRPFCEASECSKPEHIGEAHCKSLNEAAGRQRER
jgi:hypothetical protein